MSKTNITLFSQVLGLIDRNIFNKIVSEYDTDKFSKGINTWTHLVSMLFMQFANATSLRDIANGLNSATGDLNHMGVSQSPSKSSLSYQNKHRNFEVFEALYYSLLDRYESSLIRRKKYARMLKRKIFLMDSSIIPLSLSLFDWAKFRTNKGAVKLHAVLDYETGLPNYAVISDGKKHDVKAAKQTNFPAKSVLVVDRAYVDYDWLYNLDSTGVFFVTRLKDNAHYRVAQTFLEDDKAEHILSDKDIELIGFYTSKKYPKILRIVKVYDAINDKTMVLLTNNLNWTAQTISELYRARWDIEVFFKHLKQLFRIKTFVGTSPNAVRIQMWTSMIAILLFKHLKKKAKYKWNLSNLVSFLRINLYAKIELYKWLDNPLHKPIRKPLTGTLF